MENKYSDVLSLFNEPLKGAVSANLTDSSEEIRLRAGRYAEIVTQDGFRSLGIISSSEDIYSAVRRALKYSLFANEEEIKLGRTVLPGGHRISFTGRALRKQGIIVSQDSFSSLCVRLARQIKGCSEDVMKYIVRNGQVLSSLIISPPGVGKTTLLRDISRVISSGQNALRTVLIDEKGEIASNISGTNHLDVGERCDVMSLYDKFSGITSAVRNFNPQVVICDEIGSTDDSAALGEAVRCGVKIIATAHADNITSLLGRNILKEIVSAKVFDRYIFIRREDGRISASKVYDASFAEVMR